MSVTETAKRKLKVVVGAATLGLMALAGTVKGETAEKAETSRPDKDAITATVNEPAQRQKMLEEAVRSGASKEEIAKYVDFPEFIPVTKEGQFDKEKAEKWSNILKPYIETIRDKGEDMSAVEAYNLFKEATGQKDVSFEDFQKLQDFVNKASEQRTSRRNSGFMFVLTLGVCGYAAAHVLREALGSDDYKGAALGITGMAQLSALIATFITTTQTASLNEAYAKMYDTHIDQKVEECQKETKKADQEQKKAFWDEMQKRYNRGDR